MLWADEVALQCQGQPEVKLCNAATLVPARLDGATLSRRSTFAHFLMRTVED